jgi:hypothetical protein
MRLYVAATLAILLLSFATCSGAEIQQSLDLKKGFNAVYLYVSPDPKEATVTKLPNAVIAVSRWKGEAFNEVPTRDFSGSNFWQVWRREPAPGHFNTLNDLTGGCCYVIETNEATTVMLTGKPVQLQRTWDVGKMTFAGIQTAPDSHPTLKSCFLGAWSQIGDVRKLNASGDWVEMLAEESVSDGDAYLIRSTALCDFQQPLLIERKLGGEVFFSNSNHEGYFEIENRGSTEQKLVAKLSADKEGRTPPILIWEENAGTDNAGVVNGRWTPISDKFMLIVNANSVSKIKLALMPAQMKSEMDAVLTLTSPDSGFMERLVLRADMPTKPGRDGLWVAKISVTKLRIGAADQATHQTKGVFKLDALLRVVTGPKEGDSQPSIRVNLFREVIETGVGDQGSLVLDRMSAEKKQGATIGRRILAIGFPNQRPIDGLILPVKDEEFGSNEQTVSFSVPLPYDHPFSPYFHKYHPDHDNKRRDGNETVLTKDGDESFSVERNITFTFFSDPERIAEEYTTEQRSNAVLGTDDFKMLWGQRILGGRYSETVTGPHAKQIEVSGIFLLTKFSDIANVDSRETQK